MAADEHFRYWKTILQGDYDKIVKGVKDAPPKMSYDEAEAQGIPKYFYPFVLPRDQVGKPWRYLHAEPEAKKLYRLSLFNGLIEAIPQDSVEGVFVDINENIWNGKATSWVRAYDTSIRRDYATPSSIWPVGMLHLDNNITKFKKQLFYWPKAGTAWNDRHHHAVARPYLAPKCLIEHESYKELDALIKADISELEQAAEDLMADRSAAYAKFSKHIIPLLLNDPAVKRVVGPRGFGNINSTLIAMWGSYPAFASDRRLQPRFDIDYLEIPAGSSIHRAMYLQTLRKIGALLRRSYQSMYKAHRLAGLTEAMGYEIPDGELPSHLPPPGFACMPAMAMAITNIKNVLVFKDILPEKIVQTLTVLLDRGSFKEELRAVFHRKKGDKVYSQDLQVESYKVKVLIRASADMFREMLIGLGADPDPWCGKLDDVQSYTEYAAAKALEEDSGIKNWSSKQFISDDAKRFFASMKKRLEEIRRRSRTAEATRVEFLKMLDSYVRKNIEDPSTTFQEVLKSLSENSIPKYIDEEDPEADQEDILIKLDNQSMDAGIKWVTSLEDLPDISDMSDEYLSFEDVDIKAWAATQAEKNEKRRHLSGRAERIEQVDKMLADMNMDLL